MHFKLLPFLRYLLIATAFTGLWLNLHWLAAVFDVAPASSVWYPARGLSLALLLVFGLRYAPVLFVASLIGGIPYHLPDHPENLVASAAVISVTMAAVAWALRRMGVSGELCLRSAALLVLLGAAAALVTAAGVVAVNLRSGLVAAGDYLDVVLQFFVGDYLGILLIAPLALLLTKLPPPRRLWRQVQAADRRQLTEQLLTALLLAAAAGALVWLGGIQAASAYTVSTQSRWYLLLLPLALAAVRFGPVGAAVGALLVSVTLIAAVRVTALAVDVTALQMLVLAFAVISLILGSAVADRQRSLQALAAAHRCEAERARRDAEQARQSKARFLAATTHDLRHPFEAVRLGLETLTLQPLAAESATVVGRVKNAADALSRVMENVLDTARLEGEIRAIVPRRLALQPLLARLMAEKAHRFVDLELALYLGRRPAAVIADQVLLERLLRNLLANAARACRPGGRVLLGARRRGAALRLEVYDTGCGIKPAQLAGIFDDFVSHSSDGTGIGLSLVREIADQLGLNLQVRSRPGRGTVFSFELPLAGPDAGAIASPVRDKVIALAMRDSVRRALLAAVLNDWGAAVVVAATPEAAMHQLNEMEAVADLLVADESVNVTQLVARTVVELGTGLQPLTVELRNVLAVLADD